MRVKRHAKHSRDEIDLINRARRQMRRGWRRLREHLWTLVQTTLAATAAWLIALYIAGHDDPFFAPIAAVSALSASLVERALMALRLLLGVLLGISVGELASAALVICALCVLGEGMTQRRYVRSCGCLFFANG